MNATPMTRDELWKHYEIKIDLYKHYLKLTIEINVFYYAITGALLSYYLAHRDDPAARFSLVLPLLMSVLFGLLFLYGAIINKFSRAEIFRVREALGLHVAPDLGVLSWLLSICAVLMLLVALGLGGVLVGCVPVA